MNNNCKLCELRGVWISTVYEIDWPKTQNDIHAQKQEFIEILDTLQSLNFNSVFVQIRPTSDTFYKSYINPWSKYLTGTQGKSPGYDPLKFMIKETHRRNMEFHAWLNPYRITTSGTDLNKLYKAHPARLNPSWALSYDNALFYNPENPEVIRYIATTVFEIVKNYYIDGIHFDDYFYPYNYPLPQGEDRDGVIANNRREAVNNMIRLVNKAIKSTRECVQFGVSPFGVWKNKSSDPNGSDTNNLESYYDVYADSLKWIEEGIIDYIAPQIYWTIDNKISAYETSVKWWNNVVKDTGVRLYIGQNISNVDIAKEIEKQVNINRTYSEVEGSIFFSMSNIKENTGNVIKQLKEVYSCKEYND
ncbi:glycoside hydrolase family 10 protein [Romboutsia sp.]|uniref:glycoside hydrolase family 10 protein n=1 Tax=Romboutsia sp. TaxID=1965302 RepID=UPI002C02150B|nr:family 10 glycosylhydrolase [Romboutsia sp.]HSQ88880.1 family 10 glycosylhydrolase [Romboutsia sp.]